MSDTQSSTQHPQVNEITSDYANALKELTFNSKPIINNLTIIAHENIKHASEIVKVIEERIRTAPPHEKLPALYLLDSIAKNVGGVYIREFANSLVITFCRAFESVQDPNTKALYLKLLKTWPQFFPPEKVRLIEQRLRAGKHTPIPGGERQVHVNQNLFSRPSTQVQQTKMTTQYGQPTSQTEELLKTLLGLLQRQLQSGRHDVLKNPQTARLVQQLTNVLASQQRKYSQNTEMLLREVTRLLQTQTQQTQQFTPPQSLYTVRPTVTTYPSIYQPSVLPTVPSVHHPIIQPQPFTQPLTQPYTQHVIGVNGMSSGQTVDSKTLISTLQNLGYLGGPTQQQTAPKIPPEIYFLYNSFSCQCSNCARRFHSRDELAKHMDMHYKISSRKSKNKVLSRKWFQTMESYVESVDEMVVESPGAIFFNQLEEKKDNKEEQKQQEQSGVLADENQDECPVCREKFDMYWDSNSEDWMYSGAVIDPNTKLITHKLCLNSSLKRTSDTLETDVEQPPEKKIKLM